MSVLSGVKKLVSGLPRRFTAVDFDSRQMRIVHAEHVGGRMRVLKLHQLAMPPETDLSNAQLVGQVLGKGIRDFKKGMQPEDEKPTADPKAASKDDTAETKA